MSRPECHILSHRTPWARPRKRAHCDGVWSQVLNDVQIKQFEECNVDPLLTVHPSPFQISPGNGSGNGGTLNTDNAGSSKLLRQQQQPRSSTKRLASDTPNDLGHVETHVLNRASTGSGETDDYEGLEESPLVSFAAEYNGSNSKTPGDHVVDFCNQS